MRSCSRLGRGGSHIARERSYARRRKWPRSPSARSTSARGGWPGSLGALCLLSSVDAALAHREGAQARAASTSESTVRATRGRCSPTAASRRCAPCSQRASARRARGVRRRLRGGLGRHVGHRDRHARERQPRSILTLAPLRTGLSGGITLKGSLATIAGAVCVALVVVARARRRRSCRLRSPASPAHSSTRSSGRARKRCATVPPVRRTAKPIRTTAARRRRCAAACAGWRTTPSNFAATLAGAVVAGVWR